MNLRGSTSRTPRLPRRLRRLSVLRLLLLLGVYAAFMGAACAYNIYAEFARDLPENLHALYEKPNLATQVYSADGELIGQFYLQRRIEVPLARIPLHVQRAFISAEDRRFWEHPGFDPIGILRAAWANYIGGHTVQGASTITQQVTRMLLLTPKRTYSRKIKELILAVRVERELTKRQILSIYLNHVYLGHGAYGVEAAAEVYFGKTVDNLSLAEGAVLAGLPQAPSAYSPNRHFKAARARQRYVLKRMNEDGYITADERAAAEREPLAIVDSTLPLNNVAAPYFVSEIRRWATQRYGAEGILHSGLRIFTSLDMRMQRIAQAAVRDGLDSLDHWIGFRGPLAHLGDSALARFIHGRPHPYVPGIESAALGSDASLLPHVSYVAAVVALPGARRVVVNTGGRELDVRREDARELRSWRGKHRARLRIGDTIPIQLSRERGHTVAALAQRPDVQAALIAMDPHTGRVRAMVGGYDYRQSQFNRATQAHRQIGSAIKPFIYATALAHGMTQLSIIQDAPIAVRVPGGVWAPKNYERTYRGPVTLRTALAHSINTVSVRTVLRVGVDAVIDMMRRLGIKSPISRHITLALGTPGLTLLEVASAYCAFDNAGKLTRPRMVELVTTDDGKILEDHRAERPTRQVISPQLAYLVANMMESVVQRGTGRRAQALGRPTAAKTGTSSDYRDAWFMGYTPDLLAGVWVGRDDFKPIAHGATGARAALPIWLQFMRAAHPHTPVRDFTPPDDVLFVRADEITGQPAPPGAWQASWIPFARGTVPPRFTEVVPAAQFRGGSFETPPRSRASRAPHPAHATKAEGSISTR